MAVSTTNTNEMITIYDVLAIIIATISLIATIINVWLIRKMNWNGYMLILYTLAIYQLIFDISFYFLINQKSVAWSYSLFLLFNMFGELSSTLLTNILSIIVFRIVYNLKVINIFYEYKKYLFCTITIPLLLIVCALSFHQLNLNENQIIFRIYYYIIFAGLIFNIILYLLTNYYVHKLDNLIHQNVITIDQANAIKVLVSRMKYYPISQVILRLGPVWLYFNRDTQNIRAARYIYVLTTPATGIVYFIVFLLLQPIAKKILMKSLYKVRFFAIIIDYIDMNCSCINSCCNSKNSSNDNDEKEYDDNRDESFVRSTLHHEMDDIELTDVIHNKSVCRPSGDVETGNQRSSQSRESSVSSDHDNNPINENDLEKISDPQYFDNNKHERDETRINNVKETLASSLTNEEDKDGNKDRIESSNTHE